MTPPSWLNDPTVKVYAAKHLPVVRVEDGKVTFGPNDFDRKVGKKGVSITIFKKGKPMWVDMNVWPDIADALYPELRAAWDRLCEGIVTLGTPPPQTAADGFYYLAPEQPSGYTLQLCYSTGPTGKVDHMTPPTLVSCEDVTDAVMEMMRDGVDLKTGPWWKDTAALVFHYEARECEAKVVIDGAGWQCRKGSVIGIGGATVDQDFACPTCHGTGTLPEAVHVELREGGEK
jgi:hypothetical protein